MNAMLQIADAASLHPDGVVSKPVLPSMAKAKSTKAANTVKVETTASEVARRAHMLGGLLDKVPARTRANFEKRLNRALAELTPKQWPTSTLRIAIASALDWGLAHMGTGDEARAIDKTIWQLCNVMNDPQNDPEYYGRTPERSFVRNCLLLWSHGQGDKGGSKYDAFVRLLQSLDIEVQSAGAVRQELGAHKRRNSRKLTSVK